MVVFPCDELELVSGFRQSRKCGSLAEYFIAHLNPREGLRKSQSLISRVHVLAGQPSGEGAVE